ncbi:MAG: hypothetical protein H7X80_09360, partial [bacterium]|nr:hypothetical protein [Candidatus Kapabacteria bacterium]
MRFLLASLLLSIASVCAVAQSQQAGDDQRRFDEVLVDGQESAWVKQSGEDVAGRSYWFELQRRYPFDVVPAGARKDAIKQMNTLRD